MPHLVAFRLQVSPPLGHVRCDDRNLVDDLEVVAVVDKGVGLLGVVRQETNPGETKVLEDLQADTVVARVGAEAQRRVGLNGIEPSS